MCPYGEPGDRLYVRECFVTGWDTDGNGDVMTEDDHGNPIPERAWYRADGDLDLWLDENGNIANVPWKPSIHMPRKWSRITLEIAHVMVERLCDIRDRDAVAEGYENAEAFLQGEWARDKVEANPWVWAIYFRRIAA